MRLVRLEIKKLHGTLTREIDFDPNLNLLVGINGSGKTSILNFIDWLLKPDFGKLAATNFESVRLVIEKDGERLSILAKHESSRLLIVEENGVYSNEFISIDLIKSPASITSERDFVDVCQHYSRLGPEKHERALWRALNSLPKPLTITLDRTISAEVEEQVYFEEAGRVRVQRGKAKSPLDKVVEVTQAKHAEYRGRLNRLNEHLKTRIVASAFNSPFRSANRDEDRDVSLEEIAKLEKKVTSLLTSMESGSAAVKSVTNYFKDAKQLAGQMHSDKTLRIIFSVQFRQINELAQAFNEFERKSAQSFEQIGSYLSAINSFLKESKKNIGFNDKDGRIGFQYLSHAGNPHGQYTGVERLSSGEKQILILLTFLAFISTKDQIFVVDEPELSLHPKWQHNFLPAILSQVPDGMQIILATHSPEIVAGHRDSCIVLEP